MIQFIPYDSYGKGLKGLTYHYLTLDPLRNHFVIGFGVSKLHTLSTLDGLPKGPVRVSHYMFMQAHDDALDFLNSLLVVDRICPFAFENLPVMSRRVFDVGLDVSRIKNGLKINRESKRNKTIRAAPTPPADDSYHLDQQLAIIPHLQNKESSSNIAILDDDKYRNHEAVHLPSPKSPEPAMHRGFPCPPSHRSSSPVSADTFTKDPHENLRLSVGDPTQNFDLRPPPPNKPTKFLDTLGEDLLSGEHLSAILCDPSYFLRFTAFLNRYKPQSAPILIQYLEGQKAIKAIEYANALAQTMKLGPGDSNQTAYPAASVDPRFEANSKEAFEKLVTEALPAYVTHCLVKVVTESMVREITGTTMPIMRELVGGLAEVFCLSDPSAEGNPIVYASEGKPSHLAIKRC